MCSHLLNQSQILDDILQTDDVNRQVDILTSVITTSLNACAPAVTKEIRRPAAPWIDAHVREAMAARNTAQTILKRDRLNTELQNKYKCRKRQVKHLISSRKRHYYLDKLNNCKGNTAATWKVIRNIVPNNKNHSISHTPGDALRKAEEFNNFFANVCKTTYEETQRMLANETGNLAAPAAHFFVPSLLTLVLLC